MALGGMIQRTVGLSPPSPAKPNSPERGPIPSPQISQSYVKPIGRPVYRFEELVTVNGAIFEPAAACSTEVSNRKLSSSKQTLGSRQRSQQHRQTDHLPSRSQAELHNRSAAAQGRARQNAETIMIKRGRGLPVPIVPAHVTRP